MQVYRTGAVGSQYTTSLVFGLAGAGKTPLLASLPDVLIISSEPGLLSLKRYDLPYVVARDYKENMDVIAWLNSSREANKYQSIGYDSISATSENILNAEKKKRNDPRHFSPATTAQTIEIVLAFMSACERKKHLVMTCKGIEEVGPNNGKVVVPFAVVPKLGPALPYHFDNVLYMARWRDLQNGVEQVALCCRANDYAMFCRNRLGNLDLWEPSDLGAIIRKINS